jgi:hypothetical protein
MVKADIYLRLLPTSILDMHKVFEVLDAVSQAYGNTFIVSPARLDTDFGIFVICGGEMIQLHRGSG